jgi:hypothetical protein
MNNEGDSCVEIKVDENEMYYFTAFSEGKYQTLFVCWCRRDFIKAFEAINGVSNFAHIKVSLGEHTFITDLNAPLYLLNYENDKIFEFAGDYNELDLYPSGNTPTDSDMGRTIAFPSYFTKGVEPLIEFKLFNKFWVQREGAWVPLHT